MSRLRRIRRTLGRGLRRFAGSEPTDAFAAVRPLDGPTLVKVPAIVPDTARPPARSLVVLVPHLQLGRMTGGPNTALNIGARVARRGTPVRFVATHGPADSDVAALRDHVGGLVGRPVPAELLSFASVAEPPAPLAIGRRDVVMATWWPTAHVARATLELTSAREFLYLVQDFEPGFYAWSTNYALALQTYGFPIRAIFNEELLGRHVRSLGTLAPSASGGDSASISFEPAVDRELFAGTRREGPRTLLFYARPKNPRNAFELGLRALRVAAAEGAFDDDWVFLSIGDQVPELQLDARRTIKPVPWQSLPAYAALLARSDLLLSLMLSPHTSYPPLEMAASGGTVVTNTFGVKTAEALAAIGGTIVAAAPEMEAIAAALAAAARRPRPSGESVDLSLPATWDEALEPVVDWIEAALADLD